MRAINPCPLMAHCTTCRDLEGGRAWRQSLATAFELPPGAPDFQCPHDRPWGYVPTAEELAAETKPKPLAGFESFCTACHDTKNCPNAKPCCGGQLNINIVVPCPQGKFSLPSP